MDGDQPHLRMTIRPCEGQGEGEDKDMYWSSTEREDDSSTDENGDESLVEDGSDEQYDGDEDDDDDEDEEEDEEEEVEYVDYSSSSSEEEGVDKIIINITDITIEDEESRGSSSFATDSPRSNPPSKQRRAPQPQPVPLPEPDEPSN